MAIIDLGQAAQPYVVECVAEGANFYIAAGKKDRFKPEIWTSKTDVTEQALTAVSQFMLFHYLINEKNTGIAEPVDVSYIKEIEGKKKLVSLITTVRDVEEEKEEKGEEKDV